MAVSTYITDYKVGDTVKHQYRKTLTFRVTEVLASKIKIRRLDKFGSINPKFKGYSVPCSDIQAGFVNIIDRKCNIHTEKDVTDYSNVTATVMDENSLVTQVALKVPTTKVESFMCDLVASKIGLTEDQIIDITLLFEKYSK